MPPSKSFAPRIYVLAPQLADNAPELGGQLERCAEMGFDHVLAAVPRALQTTGALAESCARVGLRLLLDCDLRLLGLDESLRHRHPDWFHPAGPDDDLPDPRRPARQTSLPLPRYDRSESREEITGYWRQHLQTLVAAGAAGFRCLGIGDAPASVWQALLNGTRAAGGDLRFFAWTPGCTPAQLDALAGCGFDATFSSLAWWDYQAPWLGGEQQRLNPIAPPGAFPDSPPGGGAGPPGAKRHGRGGRNTR